MEVPVAGFFCLSTVATRVFLHGFPGCRVKIHDCRGQALRLFRKENQTQGHTLKSSPFSSHASLLHRASTVHPSWPLPVLRITVLTTHWKKAGRLDRPKQKKGSLCPHVYKWLLVRCLAYGFEHSSFVTFTNEMRFSKHVKEEKQLRLC